MSNVFYMAYRSYYPKLKYGIKKVIYENHIVKTTNGRVLLTYVSNKSNLCRSTWDVIFDKGGPHVYGYTFKTYNEAVDYLYHGFVDKLIGVETNMIGTSKQNKDKLSTFANELDTEIKLLIKSLNKD